MSIRSITLSAAAMAALAGGFLAAGSSPAHACSYEAYMGSICAFPYNFCPKNFLPADGRDVPIAQYQALFALIGARFGGDGKSTFKLPDLRSRQLVATSSQNLPGLTSTALAQKRGVETATIQVPPHTHTATFSPTSGSGAPNVSVTVPASVPTNASANTNVPSATNQYIAGTPTGQGGAAMWTTTPTNQTAVSGIGIQIVDKGSGVTGGTVTVASAGTGNGQVSVIPPQQPVTFCINTVGLWPPRP
ncbi:MAG: tail fiber protein [Pseudomonadota bacterium]